MFDLHNREIEREREREGVVGRGVVVERRKWDLGRERSGNALS